MGKPGAITRQFLIRILFWFAILGSALAYLGYVELNAFVGWLGHDFIRDGNQLNEIIKVVDGRKIFIVRFLAGSFFAVAVLLWLSLRSSVRELSKNRKLTYSLSERQKKKDKSSISTEDTHKKDKEEDQCKALQLLSLMQREGRLVDFLNENLDSFDDSQIGAAVRSIHENCKKTLDKYVILKAVIDKDEGDEIVVPPGFDAGAIKLTGNVSGKPPFKGILQHRGWQISGLQLPVLSETRDSGIIMPAEIEILTTS